jgi:hypothetical protein
MVVSERVMQLGRAQAQFDGFAIAEPLSAPSYNTPPLVQAVMLLLPAAAGAGRGQPMGSTCRVCPQDPCAARREPSILSSGV